MFKIPLLSAVLLVPLNCVDISIPIGCTDEEPRGAASIDIEGKACASRRRDLDEIELRVERVGDRAVIEAFVGENDRRSRYRRLDLKIFVPNDIPLVVEDRSGEIEISDVTGDVPRRRR